MSITSCWAWKVKHLLEKTTIATACQNAHKMAWLLRTESKANKNKMNQIATEIIVPYCNWMSIRFALHRPIDLLARAYPSGKSIPVRSMQWGAVGLFVMPMFWVFHGLRKILLLGHWITHPLWNLLQSNSLAHGFIAIKITSQTKPPTQQTCLYRKPLLRTSGK